MRCGCRGPVQAAGSLLFEAMVVELAKSQPAADMAGRNPLLRRTTYPWLRNEEGLTGLRLETQA